MTARNKARRSLERREDGHTLTPVSPNEESAEREGLSRDGETVDRQGMEEESSKEKKDGMDKEDSSEQKTRGKMRRRKNNGGKEVPKGADENRNKRSGAGIASRLERGIHRIEIAYLRNRLKN